jgi:hypothetical protein
MKLPRFSLRGLILLVTAVALYLGFNIYRRQQILAKAEYFREYKVTVLAPSEWKDYLYQRRPRVAVIDGDSEYFSKQTMTHAKQAELEAFGITDVRVDMQLRTFDFNGRERLGPIHKQDFRLEGGRLEGK